MRLGVQGKVEGQLARAVIGRVSLVQKSPSERRDHVLVLTQRIPEADLTGYVGVIFLDSLHRAGPLKFPIPVIHGVQTIDHLSDGDIVLLSPSGYVSTLYRIGSKHNAIFATERCNSFCVMCSQPPKKFDDSGRITEHLRVIELMSPETEELGITGGEPTLLMEGLVKIIARCRDLLPRTAIHVLSNGRLFYYASFARALAEIEHPDLMLGIPLYSDLPEHHDYVVQAQGAFEQTLIGVHNLGRYGVKVEVRVVIHRSTYARLPEIAEFIYRNIPFASHVALMGMEMMGFAVLNMEELWIDSWIYRKELEAATLFLSHRGMRVSVYNHQLCTIPRPVWRFARKSISDWKNDYLPICDGCHERERCGGFFSSSIRRRYSAHIRPLAEDHVAGVTQRSEVEARAKEGGVGSSLVRG